MVARRFEHGEEYGNEYGAWRAPRPTLVLTDVSQTPPKKTHARPAASRQRRTARRLENVLLAAAAVVVVLFFLASFAFALFRSTSAAYQSAFAPSAPVVTVTVGPGDTLWRYATLYGAPDSYVLDSVEAIARDNHLASDTPLVPGQRLRIVVHNPAILAKLPRNARLASRS